MYISEKKIKLWFSRVKRNNGDTEHFSWRDVHRLELSWTQTQSNADVICFHCIPQSTYCRIFIVGKCKHFDCLQIPRKIWRTKNRKI